MYLITLPNGNGNDGESHVSYVTAENSEKSHGRRRVLTVDKYPHTLGLPNK